PTLYTLSLHDALPISAKGAYLIRDYKPGQPKMGTILVQGTMSTYNTITLLPKLDELGLNVKLVAAVSPELFHRQPKAYQDSILSDRKSTRLNSSHLVI